MSQPTEKQEEKEEMTLGRIAKLLGISTRQARKAKKDGTLGFMMQANNPDPDQRDRAVRLIQEAQDRMAVGIKNFPKVPHRPHHK